MSVRQAVKGMQGLHLCGVSFSHAPSVANHFSRSCATRGPDEKARTSMSTHATDSAICVCAAHARATAWGWRDTTTAALEAHGFATCTSPHSDAKQAKDAVEKFHSTCRNYSTIAPRQRRQHALQAAARSRHREPGPRV
eukprot:365314-Chlamydomonas_euryale.AAC.4